MDLRARVPTCNDSVIPQPGNALGNLAALCAECGASTQRRAQRTCTALARNFPSDDGYDEGPLWGEPRAWLYAGAQEIGDASVTATLGAPFEGGRHERPFHDESGTQRLVQACEGWYTSNIVQDGGLFGERGTPSFALGSRRAAPFTSCAALTMKWVTRQTCRDNPTRRQEGNLGKIIVF